MNKKMPAKKQQKQNEARKRLKEIKRNVTLPDGSITRKSFYGHTIQDAERKYQEFVTPPLQAALPEGSFVWYYINKYLPLKAHLRANTKNTNRAAALHVLEEIGHLQVRNIDFAVLAEMLNRLDAKRTCRNPKAKPKRVAGQYVDPVFIYEPLGPATVNKCRSLALEVCSIATDLDDKVRPINSKRVPSREMPQKEVDVYTPAEMRRLLDVASGPMRTAIILMGFLGLRLREACGQSYTDLAASGTLEVRFQVDRATGELTTKLKSKYARRDLQLPAGLLDEIRAVCFARGRLIHWTDKSGNAHPYSADAIDRDLAVAMRRAKLRILTPHELRHSFSTWLDENGCPRSVRISLMGQTRAGVHDRYNHADPEMRRLWLGNLWQASFEAESDPRCVEYASSKAGPVKPATGESNGRSKLTAQDVQEIRSKLPTTTTSQLARDYKVDRKTITQIRNGITWKSA